MVNSQDKIVALIMCACVIICGVVFSISLLKLIITALDVPYEKTTIIIYPKPLEYKTGSFSSYNAEPGQTDSDPYTMASGKRVYEGAVANNCLKFGTRLYVQGLGEFVVEDRMNRRYGCDKFDIFRWDKKDNITKPLPYRVVDNS